MSGLDGIPLPAAINFAGALVDKHLMLPIVYMLGRMSARFNFKRILQRSYQAIPDKVFKSSHLAVTSGNAPYVVINDNGCPSPFVFIQTTRRMTHFLNNDSNLSLAPGAFSSPVDVISRKLKKSQKLERALSRTRSACCSLQSLYAPRS
jgi:hypothetical protein